MISRQDLSELLEQTKTEKPILSVYLNVDQSRSVNLNRGFEAAFKSLLQSLDQGSEENGQQEALDRASATARDFLSSYEPDAKTLVFFSGSDGGTFWVKGLGLSLENRIRWSPRPFIRPLIEARDEFERYGVILTDRARARLFKVFLGEIEEEEEALAKGDVRKFDAAGSDHRRSQMNFQRKADEHARWHLKNVAEMMDRLAEAGRFDRLVLGGPQEAVAELKSLLSPRLKKALVGTVGLPLSAPEGDILEATVKVQEEAERAEEDDLVGSLLTSAAKQQQAVAGLSSTLEALHEGKIRQLVYTDDFREDGKDCQECGKLFNSTPSACPFCQGELRSLPDLLESILVRVFQEGGEIEHVREEPAERLNESGEGIGAFLRF